MYVPAGTASIIVAAAPLVSVAASRILFDKKIAPITVVGSIVALVGVAFVCLARAGLSVSTAVWILVAAMVLQGIYHAIQRPLLNRYTGLEVGTYSIIAGTIMTLPLVPFGLDGLLHAGAPAWVAAIYLGLMPSALGYVLWAYAVARMPMAVSTSLLYLVPLVAVLIAWVWLAELPIPAEFFGGAVVIVGVATISLGPRFLSPRPVG